MQARSADGTDLGEGALGEDATSRVVSSCRARESDASVAIAAESYMSRQVFPQAPSPTITSFRRISAIVSEGIGFGVSKKGQLCIGSRELASAVVREDRRQDGGEIEVVKNSG
jgi:hypothetical protein